MSSWGNLMTSAFYLPASGNVLPSREGNQPPASRSQSTKTEDQQQGAAWLGHGQFDAVQANPASGGTIAERAVEVADS